MHTKFCTVIVYIFHFFSIHTAIKLPCLWCLLIIAATAKSLQSCPTLCDPRNSSPPGSPVPGILQARTLEWVAISFSNAWKWKVKVKLFSRVWLCATPWTAAHQGFSGKSTGVGCRCLLHFWSLILPNLSILNNLRQ